MHLSSLCLEVGNTCGAISAVEDIEIKSIQNRKQKDKSSQEEQVNKIICEIPSCKITVFYCLDRKKNNKRETPVPRESDFFDQWANIPSFFGSTSCLAKDGAGRKCCSK